MHLLTTYAKHNLSPEPPLDYRSGSDPSPANKRRTVLLALILLVLLPVAGCQDKNRQDGDNGQPPREEQPTAPPGGRAGQASCLQPPTAGAGGALVEITGTESEGGARKWVVATLVPPFETTNRWSARNTTGAAQAKLQYQRAAAATADIPWDGPAPAQLPAFTTQNLLNYQVELTDGDRPTPRMAVANGVLRVNSVMQGDIITVIDTTTGAFDRVCVVKNFTLNDMNRVGFDNVDFHADHAGVAQNVKTGIKNVIRFALEDGANTAQERERQAAQAQFAGHAPPLAVLDIPSARGVGLFPDDKSHVHFGNPPGLPQAVRQARTDLENEVQNQKQQQQIGYPLNFKQSSERSKIDRLQSGVRAKQQAAFNAYGAAATIFYIYHTYEFVPGSYYDGGGGRLIPGDPIRNIRANQGQAPTLFKPPNARTASSVWDRVNAVHVDETEYFIDRNRKIRLVSPSLTAYGKALMVSDALHE